MGSSSLGCGDPTRVPFPCPGGSWRSRGCALTADVPQVETRHHLRGDRGDKEQSWPSTCHTVFLLPEALNPKCSLFSGRDVAVSAFGYADFVSSSLPRFTNYIYPTLLSQSLILYQARHITSSYLRAQTEFDPLHRPRAPSTS